MILIWTFRVVIFKCYSCESGPDKCKNGLQPVP